MSRVLVERPRINYEYGRAAKGRYHTPYRRGDGDDDDDDAPTKTPLRDRNRRSKSLNENLQPLVRYLLRQVGRPWNKVHSEMCARIAPTSAVQKHVLDHAKQYVDLHAVLVDGVPCTLASWRSGYQPIGKHSFTRLYVCPRSGLLKRARPIRERAPAPIQVKLLRPGLAAVYLRNCWHEVVLEPAFIYSLIGDDRPSRPASERICDAVLGDIWSRAQLDAVWGKAQGRSWYAASVRPMTRAEIRMLP